MYITVSSNGSSYESNETKISKCRNKERQNGNENRILLFT